MSSRQTFFFRNLLRGLVWLSIIVIMFIFTKHNVNQDLLLKFENLFSNTGLIILIFCISEIIFGIIPPELFMIWALKAENITGYLGYAILFAIISYFAGIIGYLFGRYLNITRLYRYLRRRFLKKTELLLQEYGLYLIIVAALTPLPFSGAAMLVGAVKYPGDRYAYWSLARFARFALISWVIWEANTI